MLAEPAGRACILDLLRITETPSIRIVFLSSKFSLLQTGVFFRDGSTTQANSLDTVSNELEETIETLEALGVDVVVISPPRNNRHNICNGLASALSFGFSAAVCDFDLADRPPISTAAANLMERLDADHAVVRLESVICTDGRCTSSVDGTFLYRDSGHLSKEGSAYLGRTYDFISLAEEALEKGPSQ